jgi:DNA-binding phage protein
VAYPIKSVSYHSYLIESLKDPEETAAYIEAALEEGEPKLLQLVLTNVADSNNRGSRIFHSASVRLLEYGITAGLKRYE